LRTTEEKETIMPRGDVTLTPTNLKMVREFARAHTGGDVEMAANLLIQRGAFNLHLLVFEKTEISTSDTKICELGNTPSSFE
jgi:hypothetical protein